MTRFVSFAARVVQPGSSLQARVGVEDCFCRPEADRPALQLGEQSASHPGPARCWVDPEMLHLESHGAVLTWRDHPDAAAAEGVAVFPGHEEHAVRWRELLVSREHDPVALRPGEAELPTVEVGVQQRRGGGVGGKGICEVHGASLFRAPPQARRDLGEPVGRFAP